MVYIQNLEATSTSNAWSYLLSCWLEGFVVLKLLHAVAPFSTRRISGMILYFRMSQNLDHLNTMLLYIDYFRNSCQTNEYAIVC